MLVSSPFWPAGWTRGAGGPGITLRIYHEKHPQHRKTMALNVFSIFLSLSLSLSLNCYIYKYQTIKENILILKQKTKWSCVVLYWENSFFELNVCRLVSDTVNFQILQRKVFKTVDTETELVFCCTFGCQILFENKILQDFRQKNN